jgi:hypothetical protein
VEAVQERIDKIEDAIANFVLNVGIEFNKLYNLQTQVQFELKDFKDEMKVFKDEMKDFKDEMKEEHKRMNKEWGNLANKMGTIVEDIIAPAARPVIKQYFKCEPYHRSANVLKRKEGREYEVDVITACEDRVFMIEVRSTPRINYVDEILEKSKSFFEFNPEFAGKKLVLIFASLAFADNVINYASKKGVYVMAYREWEYMDILNFEGVKR